MMKRFLPKLLVAICLTFLLGGSASALTLLDGKLDVKNSIRQTMNIRIHEYDRDIRFGSCRTTWRLELLHDVAKSNNFNIKWYALTSYFYDYVLDVDNNVRHAIRNETGSRADYRDAQRPRNSEEWLKELYIDIAYKDLFKIRLGKQIVSWGETAEEQVADIINPLDVKYQIAFPDWEDYKLGLWMARMFYTPPNFWQDLTFEVLVIPFDFVEQRVPPAGTGFWEGQAGTADPVDKLISWWRRDHPGKSIDNCEAGLRLRGYADIGEGVDWYLSHFYSRSDTPVARGQRGFLRFIGSVLGLPIRGEVFKYPFFHSTAFSFATTWSDIGSTIRGECTFNQEVPYYFGPGAPIGPTVKEKDVFSGALSIQRYTRVPIISGAWNRREPMSLTFTSYYYKVLNHEYDKASGNYIQGPTGKDSTKVKFNFSAAAFFLNYQLVTQGIFAYNTNGGHLGMLVVQYWPTNELMFVFAFQKFWENYAYPAPGGAHRIFDQAILSIQYDF